MNIRLVGAVAAAVAALGVAGCGSSSSSSSASSTSTPTTSAGTTTAPATTGGSTTATIDAKALFLTGKPSTNAMSCAGCHTLAAAGAAGQAGPNLDNIAPDDKVAELTEMIVKPNAEIVEGYQKNVMPQDYAKSLTAAEVKALATYIDKNSKHAGD